MNGADSEAILKNLNASLKNKKLYPPSHPAVASAVRKLCQLLTDSLRDKTSMVTALVHGALVFEGNPVPDSEALYPEILKYLAEKKSDALIFEKGLTEKEITSLFDVLTGAQIQGQELQKELHARGVTHITLRSIPMGKRNFVEVYNGAVDVVKSSMGEVRMGKIPSSGPVHNIVDEITESVFSDQSAMIGLTMIKNYDNYLYNHSVNVSIMSLALGREINLSKEELHAVGIAALLHDIGKTGVSEQIIRKPGGLSSEEWDKIKEHPLLGSNIIKRMEKLQELVSRLVYEHHIRYDHSGYPQTSGALHPYSQIITICDAYDALTTLRVYQKPHSPIEAIKVMTSLSGRHFNPDVFKGFVKMIGLYPIGTMVCLSTGEIGIVTKVNPETPSTPVVKVLYDRNGSTLDKPLDMNLAADEGKGISVVATVNPATVSIDINAFFEKEVA